MNRKYIRAGSRVLLAALPFTLVQHHDQSVDPFREAITPQLWNDHQPETHQERHDSVHRTGRAAISYAINSTTGYRITPWPDPTIGVDDELI